MEIAQIIQVLFRNIGKKVKVIPASSKDEVQKDARNISDPYIERWWQPKTDVVDGISKVFNEIKLNYL